MSAENAPFLDTTATETISAMAQEAKRRAGKVWSYPSPILQCCKPQPSPLHKGHVAPVRRPGSAQPSAHRPTPATRPFIQLHIAFHRLPRLARRKKNEKVVLHTFQQTVNDRVKINLCRCIGHHPAALEKNVPGYYRLLSWCLERFNTSIERKLNALDGR